MESQIASRATLVASEEAASTSGASQTEAWFPVAPSEQQAPATPSPVDVSARSESRLPAAATGSKESLGSAPAHRTILDEHFADNPRGWPSNPESTAWLADGSYRQVARQASQFVALGAPITERLRDVVVTARFRKVGGPSGGGYGVIVRDEGPGPRDGINQGGRYYVLEAGDRGEVGIWRRENDRWIDILPWTSSPAVRRAELAHRSGRRAAAHLPRQWSARGQRDGRRPGRRRGRRLRRRRLQRSGPGRVPSRGARLAPGAHGHPTSAPGPARKSHRAAGRPQSAGGPIRTTPYMLVG